MSTTATTLLPLGLTARALAVPATWLRAEADAGRLPCLRAGKAYLFDVGLVERLLLERARQSVPTEERRRDE
jgi:hypothetical protein